MTDLGSAIDANGLRLSNLSDSPLALHLTIDGGIFTLCVNSRTPRGGMYTTGILDGPNLPYQGPPFSEKSVHGVLKPLPQVSDTDVAFIDSMIAEKHIPYPDVPDVPGKSEDEIRALGQQLFPFSPYSFQLAMVAYDWTTASFARMVLIKLFQYTSCAAASKQCPAPLDQYGIANAIWTSNWDTFTSQDPDYMRTFMMKPAWCLLEVELQLLSVREKIQRASEIENRLLSAAIQSLPRTSIFSKSQLFSGQPDMTSLDVENFGTSFVECPSNKGPVSKPLRDNLKNAISTYLAEGKIITTKAVWSFTDSIEGAIHYSNGILLVANFSKASCVWDTTSYITPLSTDPEKIEYTFMAGSHFEVQSVDEATLMSKEILVITIHPAVRRQNPNADSSNVDEVSLPHQLKKGEAARLVETCNPSREPPHTRNKTGGRRCDCISKE